MKRSQKTAIREHRKTMALQKDWTALRTKSQREYYYNPITGESSWTPPHATMSPGGASGGRKCLPPGWNKGESDGTIFYYHDDGESTSWTFPDWIPEGWTPPGNFEQMNVETKSEEAQWVAVVSSAGQTYYFNETTGESAWELPDSLTMVNEGKEEEERNDSIVGMELNPMSAAREIEMTSERRGRKRKLKGKRTRFSITGRL